MKTIKLFSFFALCALIFTSCSDDDDATPDPINEEEVITTMIVTLVDDNGTTKTMKVTDADGDGPLDPVFDVDALDANKTYTGSIEFLNELEGEDITAEVAEEDDEHQVFYVPSSSLNISVAYNDQDADGNPVGLDFTLTTTDASDGTLTVSLVHEPNKDAAGVSDGDPTNAGGETDVEAVFEVDIL